MAPPLLPARHYGPARPVTEDTPPDLLEGTMDIHVTLPSEKTVLMSVHRSTPMMDLLVQVTSAHRIAPGGHIIQVISDNIFLSYKPSTPIGTLDTSAIKIVPKNKVNEAAKLRRKTIQQQAQERNIRLKVNLPRNQLAVYRVPPKTLISDILAMVCKDKHLEEDCHEIRHPVNIDERLRGSCCLNDYQLQEICVVSKDFRPPPLSVTDLITMASITHPEDKKRRGFLGFFSRKPKSSTGDSSVSSGSAGERSISPARSDESTDGRPAPRALSPASSSGTLTNQINGSHNNQSSAPSSSNSHKVSTNSLASTNSSSAPAPAPRLSRPTSMMSLAKSRKRQAPSVPPPQKIEANSKAHSAKEIKTSLSRNSSDSSGYHEQENKSNPNSPTENKSETFETSKSNVSSSNLTNTNSASISSITSKSKRRAPPPPKISNPSAIPEEDSESSSGTRVPSEGESSTVEDSEPPASSSRIESSNSPDVVPVTNGSSSLQEVLEESSSSSAKVVDLEEENSRVVVEDNSVEEPASLPSSLESPVTSLDSSPNQGPQTNSNSSPDESFDDDEEIFTPSKQKKQRKKIPDELMTNSCENEEVVHSSIEKENKISEIEKSDDGIVEEVHPSSLENKIYEIEDKNKEEIISSSIKNQNKINEIEESLDGNEEDFDSLSSMKNFDRVDEDVFDVKGIIKIARETFGEEDEETSGEFCEDKNLVEAFNANLENKDGQINDLEQRQDEALILDDDKPLLRPKHLDESSTDEQPKKSNAGFTSKVQLSFDEEEPKRPVRRAVSITKISNFEIVENNNNENFVKKNLINELKSNIVTSPVDREPKILNLKPKLETRNDYHVILSYENTNPIRALNLLDRNDSSSSYESAKSSSRNVRSNTDSSYDSVPPPLPESLIPVFDSREFFSSPEPNVSSDVDESRSSTLSRNSESSESRNSSLGKKILRESPILSESRCSTLSRQTIPESSVYSEEANSSSVSRQSSFSDVDRNREFVKPRPPPPQVVSTPFSISTYKSRAERMSYDKKLVRSESLSSFKDIQKDEPTVCSSSPDKENYLWRKLNRSDSQRNEIYRSEETLNKRYVPTRPVVREFISRNSSPEEIEESDEDSSVHEQDSPLDVPEDFQSRFAVFEKKSLSTNRLQDTPKFDFKEKKAFNANEEKSFNLRKTKSTFDVRDGAPDGRMPADSFGTIPDAGLNSEYMRLQDDFMKWQQQLLQNQHVLHSRVAPIATNPPTINSMGKPSGLKLGWASAPAWNSRNASVSQQQQPPPPTGPKKPVEINIPIRFEGSEEVVPPRQQHPIQQPQPPTRITNPEPQQQRMMSNQVPFNAQPSWNGVPNVQVGAWQERPQEQKMNARQTAPSQTFFGGPTGFQQQQQQQQQFQPHNMQQGFQPSQTNRQNYQPQKGFQPENVQQQAYQPQQQQQNYQPQQIFQAEPIQQSYQPQQQNYQPPQQTYQPTATIQQAYQPATIQQGYQPSNAQQRYQPPSPPSQMNQPSRPYQPPPPPLQPKLQPQQKQKSVSPQPQFTQKTFADRVAPPKVRDVADDNINARFTSVVTLNNDQGAPTPRKDKVRSIVQLNNSEPSMAPTSSQGVDAPAPFQSKILSNASSQPPRKSPPVDTPMSFRLVQQATQNPPNRVSPDRIFPPKTSSEVAPRISPPRFTRVTPPKQTVSEPPRVSPPIESRVSPPRGVPMPPPPPPQMAAMPPPPPPPPMASNKTPFTKKIVPAPPASVGTNKLDAREELMMAIRKFGGSGHLRKSNQAPPN